jgi:hypothetical protein
MLGFINTTSNPSSLRACSRTAKDEERRQRRIQIRTIRFVSTGIASTTNQPLARTLIACPPE